MILETKGHQILPSLCLWEQEACGSLAGWCAFLERQKEKSGGSLTAAFLQRTFPGGDLLSLILSDTSQWTCATLVSWKKKSLSINSYTPDTIPQRPALINPSPQQYYNSVVLNPGPSEPCIRVFSQGLLQQAHCVLMLKCDPSEHPIPAQQRRKGFLLPTQRRAQAQKVVNLYRRYPTSST